VKRVYLLDTNIVSFALRSGAPLVVERLAATPRDRVAISVVTEMELRFGVAKAGGRYARPVDTLLQTVRSLPITSDVARTYAKVRSVLEKKGQPLGALDTIIAAHALTLGAILVTNNTREFHKVAGLTCEDWSI
jgi:tRNA(fMet)-specific endonuclease VapC